MWQRICDPQLFAGMTVGKKPAVHQAWSAWILAAIITVGVIAAAAPSWSRLAQPIMQETSARVIVVDLSRSMLVEDIKPNRYEHAMAAVSEIIDDGFAGETGLVVFAESAFVLAPLSRDAESLQAFIQAVDPQAMPQDGSNLAQALESALNLLGAAFNGQGQILLVTAGDSKDQAAITLAREAAGQGNRISVLAIGSAAGAPRIDERGGLQRDGAGAIQISKSNFTLLQAIATAGQGRLVVAGASGNRVDLLSSRVEASELVESERHLEQSEREAADDGVWLVWLMLPLTLLLFRRNLLWVVLLAVVIPVQQETQASETAKLWTHAEVLAHEAYRRGDYDTVSQISNNPFLLGASYYRSGQFSRAVEQFSQLDTASAHYNRGNSLLQLERYAEAIASYQLAIDLQPGMINARYNKRLLEDFLESQADVAAESVGQGEGNEPDESTESGEALETRIGIATELQVNPADELQFGSGTGASPQTGQVDPMEQFTGEDMNQDRFVLRAQHGDLPTVETIERWINSLPETSSELYKRKFLRDYRRQQLQQR